MRRPFGGALVEPEVLGGHRRHEVEVLDDLAVDVERRDDMEELVRRDVGDALPEGVRKRPLLQDVFGAQRVLPGAVGRVGERVQKCVPGDRERPQEPARRLEHAVHRTEELRGCDQPGLAEGIDLHRHTRHPGLRRGQASEQDRGVDELVVVLRDVASVLRPIERRSHRPPRRILEAEPHRRRCMPVG